MSWLESEEMEILLAVRKMSGQLDGIDKKLDTLLVNDANLSTSLDKILELLAPPPAVSFTAVVEINEPSTNKENTAMAAKALKAGADLLVNDNGTFNVILSFMDADNVPTSTPTGLTATYTASDATPGPSSLTLTPSADTSSAAGTINQTTIQALVAAGTALPTGLTISVTATWNGLPAPLTVVAAPPIDIEAGPASTFVATEAE